jgi:hypothetical protein
VIWLTIGLEPESTDASDKDRFDLGDPLTGMNVIESLSAGDIGVSQDDESKLFSYGPFRPEKAKNRIDGPACERGIRKATRPPCSRRASARLAAFAPAVVPERDGAIRSI